VALVRIEILDGWSPEAKQGLLTGVRDAVVASLRVPADDPTVQLFELPREHALLPGHASDRYVLVTVTMFAGRSLDTKRRLIEAVTRNVAALGVDREDVDLVLHELPVESLGRGGVLASRDRLSFDVEL
jgi:phenylpyruvate tautomerase PptA (4-oxalocrotonate tautomerase family)